MLFSFCHGSDPPPFFLNHLFTLINQETEKTSWIYRKICGTPSISQEECVINIIQLLKPQLEARGQLILPTAARWLHLLAHSQGHKLIS